MKELIEALGLPVDAKPEDILKAVKDVIAEKELLESELAKTNPKDTDGVRQIFNDHPHYKALYFDDKKIHYHTKEKPGFGNRITREEAFSDKKKK